MRILSTGVGLPSGEPKSNLQMITRGELKTTREWIESKTGMSRRYISDGSKTETVDMATAAVRQATADTNFDMLAGKLQYFLETEQARALLSRTIGQL